MKTCSFRGARPDASIQRTGLFCNKEPQAQYSFRGCQSRTCTLCFPCARIQQSRGDVPVVRFSSNDEHRFVSGYRSILNCPAVRPTTLLTLPSLFDRLFLVLLDQEHHLRAHMSMRPLRLHRLHIDRIESTATLSVILHRIDPSSPRLLLVFISDHREHGNRIMCEFLIGANNVERLYQCGKTHECVGSNSAAMPLVFVYRRDLVKDGMLLYRHSARCTKAMQLFLNCHPAYWTFVPMPKDRADDENRSFVMPSTIPLDPTSLSNSSQVQRSDHDAGMCMTDLPPLPNTNYTFSSRQSAEQFISFRHHSKHMLYNNNLDLYNASIVAVRE
jgi:hypothetical protein